MIKLLKQVAIFAVFVAIIGGLTALITRRASTFNTATLLHGSIDDIRGQITSEWSNANGWDSDLYESQLSMIAQSRAADIISEDGRLTLLDRANQEAWQACVKAMNAQWDLANCNASIVNHNHSGLETVILRRPALEQVPDVKEAMAIYNLYRSILAFNNAKLGLDPRFDISTNQPRNDFNAYARGIESRKASLTGNKHYPRLRHINDIARINTTSQRLNDARTRYLNSLYSQIASAYTSAVETARANDDSEQINELAKNLRMLRSSLFNSGYTQLTSQLQSLQSSLF